MRPLAFTLCGSAASVGVLALIIPSWVGRGLLGSSWEVVRPILPVTSVEYVALAWLASTRAVIRVQSRGADLVKLAVILSIGGAVGSSFAAMIWRSAVAVAVALAIAAIGGAVAGHLLMTSGRKRNSDERQRVTV